MADMITRCPKCGTAFRISDTLLKSAKGVVRCGSCLSVFNARDHLEPGRTAPTPAARPSENAPPQTPPPAPTHAPLTPMPSPSKPAIQTEEDDVDMPDWRRRSGPEEVYASASLGEQASVDNADGDDEEEDDEAWALELLKDDDDDLNIQLKKVTPKPPEPPPIESAIFAMEEDALPSPPPDVEDTFAAIDEQLAPPEPTFAAAEPLSEPTAADEDTEADPEEPAAAGHTANNYTAAVAHPESEEWDAEEEPEPEPVPEPPKRKPIRPKLEPKSTPLKDVIASLEPEPLEVNWQEPGAWRRRLLWPLLALVALLCLLAQVAWLEFDRLSRLEPYRSVYEVACRIVGCELPQLLDRSQIQTSNLLVRSHPELVDALQVDVILQNNAPFEQTFPVLELTFTNLRSEPVAARKLDPSEYLGGELAGRDKMPVRQPIHIALEIADPGSEAVSYHIKIVD